MAKRIIVLGGGRVGAAMVRDLADSRSEQGFEDLEITLADASPSALEAFADDDRVRCVEADLADGERLGQLLADQDLAVGAVPGPMGFATAKRVIEAGRHLVDISFFEEDAFELDALAREQGVTVAVDCGVAPGASNLILGRLEEELERVDRFACYVGGLPVTRTLPYEYKAPFSPIDVIGEYTRPARMRERGKDVTRPALSGAEMLEFDGIGTLEAFETDGLRTLLQTSKVPDLIEKTLRYPGHREKMELLRDSGFFSEQPITLRDGTSAETTVRPIDLAAHLLFPQWQLEDGEDELTVMRIEIDGERDGHTERHRFDLLDRTDQATGTSSMARTTGYTCTAITRLVASARYRQPGISPPELIGRRQDCFDRIMADLERRGVVFDRTVERLQ